MPNQRVFRPFPGMAVGAYTPPPANFYQGRPVEKASGKQRRPEMGPAYRVDPPVLEDPYALNRTVVVKVLLGTDSPIALRVVDRIGAMQFRRRSAAAIRRRVENDQSFGEELQQEGDESLPFVAKKPGFFQTAPQPIEISLIPTNLGAAIRGLVAVGYRLVGLYLLIEEIERVRDGAVRRFDRYSIQAALRHPDGDEIAKQYEQARKALEPGDDSDWTEDRAAGSDFSFEEALPKFVAFFDAQTWMRAFLFNNWSRRDGDPGTLSFNVSVMKKGGKSRIQIGYADGQFFELSEPISLEEYNRLTGQGSKLEPQSAQAPSLAVPIEEHLERDGAPAPHLDTPA